jgi:hypothetical protein
VWEESLLLPASVKDSFGLPDVAQHGCCLVQRDWPITINLVRAAHPAGRDGWSPQLTALRNFNTQGCET